MILKLLLLNVSFEKSNGSTTCNNDGNSCTSNTDCNLKTEYCNVVGNNCKTPNAGTCTPRGTAITKKIGKDEFIYSNQVMSWWAADNWCKANKKHLVALSELGITSSGIEKMIQSVYHLLNLRTYITAGEMEVKAWTITAGTKAPQAAGVIHTDFEKGFIRAEVISYDDFVACNGSYTLAKEKGLMRLEGKDYVVQDGDIMHFRFAN